MTGASDLFVMPNIDFDEWVALGAEGWSHKDLSPCVHISQACLRKIDILRRYFLKGEKYHPSFKHPRVNPANHGAFGPGKTGFPSETAVSTVPVSTHGLSDV